MEHSVLGFDERTTNLMLTGFEVGDLVRCVVDFHPEDVLRLQTGHVYEVIGRSASTTGLVLQIQVNAYGYDTYDCARFEPTGFRRIPDSGLLCSIPTAYSCRQDSVISHHGVVFQSTTQPDKWCAFDTFAELKFDCLEDALLVAKRLYDPPRGPEAPAVTLWDYLLEAELV